MMTTTAPMLMLVAMMAVSLLLWPMPLTVNGQWTEDYFRVDGSSVNTGTAATNHTTESTLDDALPQELRTIFHFPEDGFRSVTFRADLHPCLGTNHGIVSAFFRKGRNTQMLKKTGMLLIALLAAGAVATPSSRADDDEGGGGAVFVMTNNADGNEIIAYRRFPNGTLFEERRFSTGGRGSGGTTDPLSSQGSLTLSANRSLLFAVNAGSGEISEFAVNGAALSLIDKVPCGGSNPVAVAQHGNLVYVVNAGGTSDVVGFRLEEDRKLREIPNSTTFLSTGNSGPGSLSFSPDGQFLLVTEKASNKIDAFRIHIDGTLAPIVTNTSAGPGLFAVVFAPNGAAVASETGPAGGTKAAALSSYSVAGNGTLSPISTSVPTQGAGTCWQEITPDGRFVYTANSASSTISGFAIGKDGSLSPVSGTVVATLAAGSTDLDLGISSDGKFLYSLNTGNGTVGIFAIQTDGSLVSLGEVGGVSAKSGFNGIAAI
jgi:6-phosphogluconolactonase (cycloisomerase 2 family)